MGPETMGEDQEKRAQGSVKELPPPEQTYSPPILPRARGPSATSFATSGIPSLLQMNGSHPADLARDKPVHLFAAKNHSSEDNGDDESGISSGKGTAFSEDVDLKPPRNRWFGHASDSDIREGSRLKGLSASQGSLKAIADGSTKQASDGLLRQTTTGRLRGGTVGSLREIGGGLTIRERDDGLKVSMTLYRKDMAKLKEEKANLQYAYDAVVEDFRELHKVHGENLSQQREECQEGDRGTHSAQSNGLRLLEAEAAVQEKEVIIADLQQQLALIPKLEGQVDSLVNQLAEERERAEKGITNRELLEKYKEKGAKVIELQSAFKEVEEQREKHLSQVLFLEEQTRRLPYLEQQLQHHKVETAKLEARLKGCLEEAAGYKKAASKAAMEAEALKEHVEALEKRLSGIESGEIDGQIGRKIPMRLPPPSVRSSLASDAVLGRVQLTGEALPKSGSPFRPSAGHISIDEMGDTNVVKAAGGPPMLAQEFYQGGSVKVRAWLESAAGEEEKWRSEDEVGQLASRAGSGAWGAVEGESARSPSEERLQVQGGSGKRAGGKVGGAETSRELLFEGQEELDEEDGEEAEEYEVVRRKLGEMRAMVEQVQWKTPGEREQMTESEDDDGEDDEGIILEELQLVKEELGWRKEEVRRLNEELGTLRTEAKTLSEKLQEAERQLAAMTECQVEAAREAEEAKTREQRLVARLVESGKEWKEGERKWKEAQREWEAREEDLRTVLAESQRKCGQAEKEVARMARDREERERRRERERKVVEESERSLEEERVRIEEEKNYLELRCRRAEREVAEVRGRWEEASRKVKGLEIENESLESLVAGKAREVEEAKEESKRLVKQEKGKWMDLLERMKAAEEERQLLEVQLQEGEIKSKLLEGGWQTLQERVKALQKEVVEERVRGLQLEEAKIHEEARLKEALAAQEALVILEEERKVLKERCKELERRLEEKEEEMHSLSQRHERELCEEKLRMRAVLKEIEVKRRSQVDAEVMKARESRSRENEILNKEISRLKSRLIDIEAKPRRTKTALPRGGESGR